MFTSKNGFTSNKTVQIAFIVSRSFKTAQSLEAPLVQSCVCAMWGGKLREIVNVNDIITEAVTRSPRLMFEHHVTVR